MAQRIAGICFFRIDGVQYSLRGNLKVSPLDTEKEGIAGADGVQGYKETPKIPFIEAEITEFGSVSLKLLQSLTQSTITAQLANGKTYILRDAWLAGTPESDAAEGKVTVKFEGKSCEEDLAQ